MNFSRLMAARVGWKTTLLLPATLWVAVYALGIHAGLPPDLMQLFLAMSFISVVFMGVVAAGWLFIRLWLPSMQRWIGQGVVPLPWGVIFLLSNLASVLAWGTLMLMTLPQSPSDSPFSPFLFLTIYSLSLITFLGPPWVLHAIAMARARASWLMQELDLAVSLNLPLPTMLRAVAGGRRGRFSRELAALATHLEHGDTLTSALEREAPELSRAEIGLISVGERTGRLGDAIARIAQARRLSLHSRARASILPLNLTYTIIVMVVVVFAVMVFLIPQFEKIANDFLVEPSAAFKNFVFSMRWLVAKGYPDQHVPGLIQISLWCLAIALAWRILPLAARDRILALTPLAGDAINGKSMSDACFGARQAILAGNPLHAAVATGAGAASALGVRQRWLAWSAGLCSGAAAGSAARSAGLPLLMAEMVGAADRGGSIRETFDFLERYYALKATKARETASLLIGPAMTLCVGMAVAWIGSGLVGTETTIIWKLLFDLRTY